MDQTSKRRSRPTPDAIKMKPIAFDLEEALIVENIYRPNLLAINQNDRKPGEVTLVCRDGAIQTLRFLRIWYRLPHTVLFSAISYLDMFLMKMKVQEKYLKCVTLSCLHLAVVREDLNININNMISVSQSKCTSKDVLRMSDIIKNKLSLDDKTKTNRTTTPADFIRIFCKVFDCLSLPVNIFNKAKLYTCLEVVLSNSSCAFFRSCAIALTLLQIQLEKIMSQDLPSKSVHFVGDLLRLVAAVRDIQHMCKIKTSEQKNCYLHISKALKIYESGAPCKSRQELSWRFSSSTVDKAYYLRNYQLHLNTIPETAIY